MRSRILSRWARPASAIAVSRSPTTRTIRPQFMQAFGRDVNEEDMVSAFAAYERTLASFDRPSTISSRGDANAISTRLDLGWELFNRQGPFATSAML